MNPMTKTYAFTLLLDNGTYLWTSEEGTSLADAVRRHVSKQADKRSTHSVWFAEHLSKGGTFTFLGCEGRTPSVPLYKLTTVQIEVTPPIGYTVKVI